MSGQVGIGWICCLRRPAALACLVGGQALRHPLVDQLRHGHPAMPGVLLQALMQFRIHVADKPLGSAPGL